MQLIRQVMQEEGIRGFYRGYLPTIMREIPFSLIQFPLWEYFKGLLYFGPMYMARFAC